MGNWSRIDSGFWRHPKFEGWTAAQKWMFGELIGYCAEYKTSGKIPQDLALLPRGISPKFLQLCEQSGWVDRDENNDLWIHDWEVYHPADSSAAERMRRFRDRNANRNGDRNQDRNTDRNENVTSHAGTRGRYEDVNVSTTSLPQDKERAEREREKLSEQEQARQTAWHERATKPDVHSPTGFITAGIRSGNWPDEYELREQDKRRERAIENGSGQGPAYVAGLIRNGVITERHELETELALAGVDDQDRESLVLQFDLAHAVAEQNP